MSSNNGDDHGGRSEASMAHYQGRDAKDDARRKLRVRFLVAEISNSGNRNFILNVTQCLCTFKNGVILVIIIILHFSKKTDDLQD